MRIHGALHQRHLRMGVSARHSFGQTLLMRDAAEHVLVQHAGRGIEEAGRRAAAILERARHLPVDIAVHAIDDFRPECRLGDMSVDIDNEIIVEPRFPRGVGENVARVGLDIDLGQFAHLWSTLAVLAIARRRLRHGFPPIAERARSRASGQAAKYQ